MAISPLNRIRYEFDKSGTNPNNLVSGESHVLSDRLKRVFMPKHAHFYCQSVVIRDKKTGSIVPKTSYSFDDESETIAMLTGKAAASIIIIHDSTVSKNITIDYQVVGGQYSSVDVKALVNRLNNIDLDNRPVSWNNIFNKPKAYNPTEHLHPLWQTFGYENLVYVVERLVQATLTGDEASHTVIWNEINQLKTQMGQGIDTSDLINQINQRLGSLDTYTRGEIDAKDQSIREACINDVNVLGGRLTNTETNVQNINNSINGISGEINQLKATDTDINESITRLRTDLNEHINNRNNPHQVTAADVGTLTTNQINGLVNTKIGELTQVTVNLVTLKTNELKAQIANDYYTKPEVDQRDTTSKDYALSRAMDVYKVIQNTFFGKWTRPSFKLTAKDGTQEFQTNEQVVSLAESHLGRNLKLHQDIIPISNLGDNALRWEKNGLYVGMNTEKYKSLYVDPDTGVDEPIDTNPGRGTKEKPLATFFYALAQGPEGIERTIYLAEGKKHHCGKPLVSVDSSVNGTRAPEFSSRYLRDQMVFMETGTFRGGNIHIKPYGTRYDAILAESKTVSSGLSNDSIRDKFKELDTRIVFHGYHTTKAGDTTSFTPTRLFFKNNPNVYWNQVNIEYAPYDEADIANEAFVNNPKMRLSGHFGVRSICSAVQHFTMNFHSVCFDTGGIHYKEGQSLSEREALVEISNGNEPIYITSPYDYVNFIHPTIGKQHIYFKYNRFDYTSVKGFNPVIDLTEAVSKENTVNFEKGYENRVPSITEKRAFIKVPVNVASSQLGLPIDTSTSRTTSNVPNSQTWIIHNSLIAGNPNPIFNIYITALVVGFKPDDSYSYFYNVNTNAIVNRVLMSENYGVIEWVGEKCYAVRYVDGRKILKQIFPPQWQ